MQGTMGTADSFGVQRPNTADGATRSGVVFALDPGTGVGDTAVHITSKSPFIQNCSHFGSGSVGIKIDGSLHNAVTVQFLQTTLLKYLTVVSVFGHLQMQNQN